jgi:chromosome partitioning protein
MKTIAVINRKGGIGKSTATVSLGGAMALAGKKVLLIDFDPQATLTTGLLSKTEKAALPTSATGTAIFGGFTLPERLIIPTRFPGLSLVPGSWALDEFNESRDDGGLFALRDFLNGLEGFDRALIDCAPNLYALSRCAMTAADFVLCPTVADPDGVEAIPTVNEAIARIQASSNPGLMHLGILLGQHRAKNPIQVSHETELRSDFPDLLFADAIPYAAVVVAARHARKPVGFHKPKCAAAQACARIVAEIERRITLRQGAAEPKRKEAA